MWLVLSLLCAFLVGTEGAVTKKLLFKAPGRVIGWAMILFALPWLLLGPLFAGWPVIAPGFWPLAILMIPLEVTAYLSSLRAMRTSPLSLTVPFLAFTPILTVFTGWLFLGERVTAAGFLGVSLVTAGAYVVQVERAAEGVLEPIKAIWKTPGIRLMLLTATLYSFTSTLSKRAVQLSSAAVFPLIYFFLDFLALTAVLFRGGRGWEQAVRPIRSSWKFLVLGGALLAGGFLTHCVAIQFVPVAYFLSVKRLSLLVSVLYGAFLFHEEAFRQRIAGTALMTFGAVLISVFG